MEPNIEQRRLRRLRNRTGNVPQALKMADALIAAARTREWVGNSPSYPITLHTKPQLRSSLVGTDGWRRNVVAEVRYYADIAVSRNTASVGGRCQSFGVSLCLYVLESVWV